MRGIKKFWWKRRHGFERSAEKYQIFDDSRSSGGLEEDIKGAFVASYPSLLS